MCGVIRAAVDNRSTVGASKIGEVMKTLEKQQKTDSTAAVIHANVFDPSARSLFKMSANENAECQTIFCSNDSCPLRSRGQCYMRGGLFGNQCPYGKSGREVGPTKRASGCHKWVRDRREKYKGVPFLAIPPEKMEFIGEFVLLPYAHMTMCEQVPFRSRSVGFSSGNPFLPLEHWTIETVLALLSFRPHALFGGEIVGYQKEQIPKFLTHLREVDFVMWKQLIAVRPQYDVKVNHIGRKAVLQTLSHPIEWTESSSSGEYPVRWKWDGETLSTDSLHAYNKTWGGIGVESVSIQVKPKPRTEVVVKSNDWVKSETEFTS